MKHSHWLSGAAALGTLLVLYLLLGRTHPEPGYRTSSTVGESAGEHGAETPSVRGAPLASSSSSAPGRTTKDRARREELQRRIHEAMWAQSGQSPPRGDPMAMPPGAPLGAAYIQARIREDFKPMALKCYEELLARSPDAGGRAEMEFTIVADEKLGGVVEEANLGDGGTLNDERFGTCLRESLTTVAFAPPPSGGKTTVRYPITFLPDGPSDADSPRP